MNPAALGGGTAGLTPYFPTVTQVGLSPALDTPWVAYPDRYSATCETKGGATWLQVTATARPGDVRPVVRETLGPDWGYHLDDVNIALGNLVSDVAGQENAWTTRHS